MFTGTVGLVLVVAGLIVGSVAATSIGLVLATMALLVILG